MLEFFTHGRDAAHSTEAKRPAVRAVMTSAVVTVEPDTPVREIARLLNEKGISGVPVVDSAGAPVGMVSDGDLIGRAEADRRARRAWWLTMVAQEKPPTSESLAELASEERTAMEIMTTPVITVGPDTDVGEVAELFASHRIKRTPVVENGRIIGIVSRADLVRALLLEPGSLPAAERDNASPKPAAQISEPHHSAYASAAEKVSAEDFRKMVRHFDHLSSQRRETERRAATELRSEAMKRLTDHHLREDDWRATLQRAKDAAACGAKEILLLRFPHDLCSDGGRAINAPEPDWPQTLRGEAAEIYLRWKNELQPLGFQLGARILDFPGGFIGDVGLFLVWGK
jgi:CBS domain-containing protein